MGAWRNLPAEVQRIILNIILDRHREDHDFVDTGSARAGYAVVCHDWRDFFEPLNFRFLLLDQDRIRDFKRITEVGSRRSFVKHLWLRVRLGEYGRDVCRLEEDENTKASKIFTKAVMDLMAILSMWPGPENPDDGLTFELSAFSPSDSKHASKYLCLEQNYPYQETEDLDHNFTASRSLVFQQKPDGTLHDPTHGWIDGQQQQQQPPENGSKLRLQGSLQFEPALDRDPLQPHWESLTVHVITGLLIRRQFHRKIPIRLISDIVYRVCPSLKTLRHESWRDVVKTKTLISYPSKIKLPDNLQTVITFADHDDNHDDDHDDEILHTSRGAEKTISGFRDFGKTVEASLKCVSQTFSTFTENLEIYSQSAPGGSLFFHLFKGKAPPPLKDEELPYWPRLRLLVLRAGNLREETDWKDVRSLLISAGRAAARMPRLETMEIWNGSEGHLSIFRYTTGTTTNNPQQQQQQEDGHEKTPTMSWISSWKWGPHPRGLVEQVACAWEEALGLERYTIQAEVIRVPVGGRNPIHSQWSAISRLKLRDIVLHPISQCQLRWEDEERDDNEKAMGY